MERLAELFDYVLVEADGSAHRPMKAHAPYEPVIPALTGQTVCVVGASGFGLPVRRRPTGRSCTHSWLGYRWTLR